MTGQALWQQNAKLESIEITSSQMLDELLDALSLRAKETNMPFSVQIGLDDDSGILITVGSEISHLEFYSASHRPPVVASISQENADTDEIVTILHGGVPSTVLRASCVPIKEARAAVQQYFATGRRPTNINWNDL